MLLKLHPKFGTNLRAPARIAPRRVTYRRNANRRLPRHSLIKVLIHNSGEDLRRYAPTKPYKPLRALDGRMIVSRPQVMPIYRVIRKPAVKVLKRGRIQVLKPALRRKVVTGVQFRSVFPADAVVCARRHVRKSVIHALGFAGGRGQKTPRHNVNSKIICR